MTDKLKSLKLSREHLRMMSLGSKMIDPPVVKRALRAVEMAEALNILPRNWRNSQ